ncbi:MAG: precorrin-4 C(11)-methyltransferase [Candidatus Hydrogenedentota bacterium]
MKVFFIGAGPGDYELLTIKAKKIISRSDIVIYAGSLINKDILKFTKKHAITYDSSNMTLEEILKVIENAKSTDKIIARLHSGDPSIYSAIQEQIEWCQKQNIDYEVVPGVSSFCAASASLKQELTLPGISQTVIISRISGRTKVPPKEDLKRLSKIKATLIIFLSVDRIKEVVDKLLYGYPKSTPVACVYRASWPDEKIIRGTLEDIADKLKKEGIRKQAIVFVGEVLRKKGFKKSKLYNKTFSHSYRRAR